LIGAYEQFKEAKRRKEQEAKEKFKQDLLEGRIF
jgi:hypothetical protein